MKIHPLLFVFLCCWCTLLKAQPGTNKLYFTGALLLTANDSSTVDYEVDTSQQEVKLTIPVEELDKALNLSGSSNEKDFVRIEFSKALLKKGIVQPKLSIQNFPTVEDIFFSFEKWAGNEKHKLILNESASYDHKGGMKYTFKKSFNKKVKVRAGKKVVSISYQCTFHVNVTEDRLIKYDIRHFTIDALGIEDLIENADDVYSRSSKKKLLAFCVESVRELLNTMLAELPGNEFNAVVLRQSNSVSQIKQLIH